MPLYEYDCRKCGAVTEVLRSLRRRDASAPNCKECGRKTERRVSVPAPAQFKGGGFYATDYRAAPK